MMLPVMQYRPSAKEILDDQNIQEMRKLKKEEKFVWQLPEHFVDSLGHAERTLNHGYKGLTEKKGL